MRFNSKNITLNRGVNLRIGVQIPPALTGLVIPYSMWESSVTKFNKELDKRRQVKELLDEIEVDILRLNLTGGAFYLWLFAKKKDENVVKDNIKFTIKGKLVYENEKSDIVEDVLIEDILFRAGESWEWKSVFKRTKELTS